MSPARGHPFVGRRAELTTATLLLDAAARGASATLLVTGEAGVGKSRLVSEVATRAARRGSVVLTGHAVEGGGTYRPFAEAIAPSMRRRPLLDSPRPAAFRSALRRIVAIDAGPRSAIAEPEPALDPNVLLGEAVLALLAELRGDRGCLLVLEDLHWADPDTVELARYLAGALAGSGVLLVLTARDETALPGLSRLAAAPEITPITLGRLDTAEVAALAAACRDGRPLPPAQLREVVARSDGLAFIVEELLADDVAAAPVPPTLAGLVAGRLAALPSERRPVLLAAAILGEDQDWRLLGSVSGVDEPTVLTALRAATDVGLLMATDGRLHWRHALTRDAVLATLLPPERAALAARAAHALDERGEPADRADAARLFVEAGEQRRAAEILLELAASDIGLGALRSASELLERAAATGRLAGKVSIERVRVLTLLGRPIEAVEVGEAALAAGTVRGDEHAELCLRLARAAVASSRWAAAEEYVERAGRPADPRSRVLVADAAHGAGDAGRAAAMARAAVRAAEGADPVDAPVLCEALMVLSRASVGPDLPGAVAAARRVAQVAAEHGLTPWRVEALFGLGSLQHSAEAHPTAPALATARELALRTGMLTHALQAELVQSNAVLLADGPAAALPLALRVVDQTRRLRLTALQSMAELVAAGAAAMTDDLPAMSRLLDAAGSRPEAPAEATALAPAVRALPHLLRHDLVRAAELVDQGVPALLAHGSAVPIEHFGLWALLRTAAADRDREARETLRGHRSMIAKVNRCALGYADAIAAGRAGFAQEAADRFAEADAGIARLPWWNRLLRLIALEAAVADGWGEPVPALRADLAVHERNGAERLARTCRNLLRAAGAPTRRRGALGVPPPLRARGVTSREAEVLALVADGLTNAQAAQRLFVSPRTVDTHVARLLAKTGAADRVELRRWAIELDDTTR
jgi:DNA-binding CsgD family transcriptional regulator